jgi:hypothetical protein
VGIACEADTTARPPGSLARRRLRARRALTHVTDFRDPRFRTKPQAEEVMPAPFIYGGVTTPPQRPAINTNVAQTEQPVHLSWAAQNSAAQDSQLDITSESRACSHASASRLPSVSDKQKPGGGSSQTDFRQASVVQKGRECCAQSSATS